MGQGQRSSDTSSNHPQLPFHGSPTLTGEPSSLLQSASLTEKVFFNKQQSDLEAGEHISITTQQPFRPSGPLLRTSRHADAELSAMLPIAGDASELSAKVTAWAGHMEAFFEAMSDGLCVYDQKGSLIYANAAAQQTLTFANWSEYALHPLSERMKVLHLYDETGASLAQERWPLLRLLRGELISATQAETVVLHPSDARELRLQLSGVPLYDAADQSVGAILIFKAVQERTLPKQQSDDTSAEMLLELLKLVFDELPCGVSIVQGEEAQLVLANREATKTWGALWQSGQPIQDFFQSKGVVLFGAEGEPLPPEEPIALQAVRLGDTIEPRPIFIRHPDGRMHLLLAHALALDPRVFGVFQRTKPDADSISRSWAVVIMQDITGLKEAEQLKRDIKAMKEAEQLKDNFIATAAHELRSPLTALMGYAEMLNQQAASSKGSELAEWQIEALETIAHDTMRIVGLTNDLLDVTRLQAGQLPLHRYNTNLVALANRVVTRLHDTTKRHTLVVEPAAQRIAANVDVQRIEQAITNLVNNAIKYSPEGGKILLSIQEDVTAGMVVISVRDQGIGIPLSQQAQIFSRFFRATNVTRLGLEGSGLGLYLSRELVQLHGGHIWFESSEEQGTTFFLSLPLANGPTL